MKILVHVTKEILEASKMCAYDAKNCAIARSLRQIMQDVKVNSTHIVFSEKEIPLPTEAQRFIKLFDALGPNDRVLMSPISFEIEVPDSYIDSIGIEDVKDILSRSKTLELVKQ